MNIKKEIEMQNILPHCPFCGKGWFWASLLNRLVLLPNGWLAHKKCYEQYEKHESDLKQVFGSGGE